MNKRFDMRILWGSLLVGAGVLFLLEQMNLIPNAWDIVWSLVFGIAGCVFLYAFFTDRSQWWPLIPGLGLLSLAAIMVVDELFPGTNWTGAIFLAGIGLSFWLVYFISRENWWAVIPGGVLLTLALVVFAEDWFGGDFGGGVFMIGLGLTFVLVGLLPTPQGRMKWAFIPAAVLLLIGVFLTTPLLPLLNYVWPVALILLGGYFILRNLRA